MKTRRCLFSFIFLLFFVLPHRAFGLERFFPIQSIDTMKFSRDAAGSKMSDPSYDSQIDTQVRNIAQAGATHIALGTPYDKEFVPFLKRWVNAARKYNLNVWFRGNFSGWEGWFGYDKNLDRSGHIKMTTDFILRHPDLFQDGDVFTACPECENGGPGDPRQTGDVTGFRNFLIDEYNAQQQALARIGKKVIFNYNSMNGDVARLVMDKPTTRALGGVVTIDHYVSTPDKLASDIATFAKDSGGKVVLGEFGAPIPDINGDLSPPQQSQWINDALEKVIATEQVIAINYWTNKGSSTALWNDDDTPRQVVSTVENYYSPTLLTGQILDDLGVKIPHVTIQSKHLTAVSLDGNYTIPVLPPESVLFQKAGLVSVSINTAGNGTKVIKRDILLSTTQPSIIDIILRYILNLFPH